MPLSAAQLRTKTHHALALGHRHHRHPPPRPLHGLSLRYGGAIDGRIAALADSGQRTLVRVRLRSPISGFVRTCTEGVSVSVPNDSKCGFSFDEIHGLRNLMREPALASALDEVSR